MQIESIQDGFFRWLFTFPLRVFCIPYLVYIGLFGSLSLGNMEVQHSSNQGFGIWFSTLPVRLLLCVFLLPLLFFFGSINTEV